jgi:hypothetical protein
MALGLFVGAEIIIGWFAAQYPHVDDFTIFRPLLLVFLAIALLGLIMTFVLRLTIGIRIAHGPLQGALAVTLISCMILYWTAYPDRLPISAANGMYRSRDFGTVTLSNGVLTARSATTLYVIEADKVGPYLLVQDTPILGSETLIFERTDSWGQLLRLDNNKRPNSLVISDPAHQATFLRER